VLAGLDDVAWEDLEHAYGSAEDVPMHLRSLLSASADERAKAQYWLSASIHHQGSVYSATSEAVPFLVALARDEATPDRAWVVRFLADVAVGRPDAYGWAGFDPGVLDEEGAGADDARAAYDAVEEALDDVLALFADGDAEVRACAARTASFFPRRNEDVRDAACALVPMEKDPRALASLLLCIAIQDLYARDQASRSLIAPHLEERDPGLALAAAIAVSYGDAPDPAALAVFARELATPPPLWSGFPWQGGDLAALALGHLRRHASHAPERVSDIYFATVERVDDESAPRDLDLARAALRPLFSLVTPEPPPTAGWMLATLRPSLKRFAEAVARRPMLLSDALCDALEENALPADLAPLRTFLGIEIASPLDAVVTIDGKEKPVREHACDARLAAAVATRADALEIAVALTIAGPSGHLSGEIDGMSFHVVPGRAKDERDAVPPAIVDGAAAHDPSRTHAAALALAERWSKKGPPVSYGRGASVFPRAMTLAARAAARVAEKTGKTPEAVFDVMIEAELASADAWGDVERYFRALPQDRVEAILLGLASRGWKKSYPDTFPISIDKGFVDRVLALLEPSRRERFVLAVVEHGDHRAITGDMAKHATPAVVLAVLQRVARTHAEMKNWAKDEIEEARERDAGALARAGLAAYATVRRAGEDAPEELSLLCAATLEAIDAESFVGSAMRDARIDVRDERGLVPLADARRVVEATHVFRKGAGEMKGGTFVLESDRVWAALLSLDSAEELVRHAKRIEWEFHVRGRDNIALFERWGAGILPWIESRIDERGVLTNVPWCIVPCLLAMDGKDALRVALKVDSVNELFPGQSPVGPGVFAADDDDDDEDDEDDEEFDDEEEEEEEEEPEPEPAAPKGPTLDLARRWIAHHAHGYAMLAELADDGDARAADLLRERAKALGGVVHEAIESSLGRDRTAAIAKKLALPKSTLAPEIEKALAEAETHDEPRGPLWTIAELDDAAREFDLPIWDNARYTVGAMRITGFASRDGDALVIETLSTNPSASDLVAWEAHAFGPGAREKQYGELLVDIEKSELERIELDGADYVDGVTNTIHLWGKRNDLGKPVKGSTGATIIPHAMPPEHIIVDVKRAALGMRGEEQRVSYKLPRAFAGAEDVRRMTPDEGLVVQLGKHHADALFAFDTGLVDKLGLPADAVTLFSFDDFEYVAAGEPASSSKDLVLMVEALRRRKKITRLVGKANARPEVWMPGIADARSYAGEDAWAPEDDPFEPAYPDAGAFASPFFAWLVAERGYPHGISLMHSASFNAVGQAEQTVPYLLGAKVQAMQGHWPRRTACIWARVIGLAEEWSPGDKAARRAMKNDSMLYAPEARKLVARFASRAWSPPAFVGAELAGIVEALCGPRAALEAFADALDGLSPAAFGKEHPALAAAIFELGFVLRRSTPDVRAAFEKRLEARWAKATEGKAEPSAVVRALDLALHGRKGAERSARLEGDYVLSDDDRAWAKERLLDPKTPPSRPDLLALFIAGEAMIDKWAARLARIEDAVGFAVQITKASGQKAIDLVLSLYETRPETQATIVSAIAERADAKDALAPSLRGPHAETARALLDAVERREEEQLARASALDDEDDEDEDDDRDEDDDDLDDEDDDDFDD
jgi:hypothetical protein